MILLPTNLDKNDTEYKETIITDLSRIRSFDVINNPKNERPGR
jgi:hypothetical protein